MALRIPLGEDLGEDLLLAAARGASLKPVFGREAQARVKAARATVENIVSKGAPPNSPCTITAWPGIN